MTKVSDPTLGQTMSDEACNATTCAACGKEAKRLIQATQAGFLRLPGSGRPGLTDPRSRLGCVVLSVLSVCPACFRDRKKMAEAWEQDWRDVENEVAVLGAAGELPGVEPQWTFANGRPN